MGLGEKEYHDLRRLCLTDNLVINCRACEVDLITLLGVLLYLEWINNGLS